MTGIQNNEISLLINRVNTSRITVLSTVLIIYLIALYYNHVHRCGTGDSMRACHAAGPGSILGRDRFPG